ncbi:N-acetyltransferase YodP [bioreactor metagenome]|uniref:N-acetyltransferase YodP n=1 Tax=bioreactor metagenome TaxID=1076179 RepID=A0A645DCV6_9ZZZZ
MINSCISHDKENNRIYLMKLKPEEVNDITYKLDDLAKIKGYTKIFAKVPSFSKDTFLKENYRIEAKIPKFYKGVEDGLFMAKYLLEERSIESSEKIIEEIINKSKQKSKEYKELRIPKGIFYKKGEEKDAEKIANFYKRIFTTYPFPIDDPSYIVKTMKENIIYHILWKDEEIVSMSSSEIDEKSLNVEMTDFGTIEEFRGNSFANYLLDKMEEDIKSKGFKTAYTIARAVSYGMNITFARSGYIFAGTLIKNTNIAGSIESMNVWYKHLDIEI